MPAHPRLLHTPTPDILPPFPNKRTLGEAPEWSSWQETLDRTFSGGRNLEDHVGNGIHSFICSLNYYSVPSFAPSTGDARVKDTQPLYSWSLQSRIWQGNKPNKPTNIIIYAFIYIYIHTYTHHTHMYIPVCDYKLCSDKGIEHRGQ